MKEMALTNDELSVLCWQLAQLCRAGISWAECAALLLEETTAPKLRLAVNDLHDHLADGDTLAQAMAHSGRFPPYLLRMVDIGQASGRTDQVLSALSTYYRREATTADAVRRAVTYPAIMAALISLVFLVLVVRVLPVFSQVFTQLGVGLSPVAAAILRASSAGKYIAGGLALLLLLAAVVLLLLFRRGGGGMALFARGATALSVARGRFASAMSLMLQSGLPLDESTERAEELLSGSPLAPKLADCRRRMGAGEPFPKAVESAGILTGMQAGLLAAGFRTGAAQAAMDELAGRCQAEGDERLSRLLGRFEYSLVVVLCLAVGLVLLSVMLPLLGVLAAIGG